MNKLLSLCSTKTLFLISFVIIDILETTIFLAHNHIYKYQQHTNTHRVQTVSLVCSMKERTSNIDWFYDEQTNCLQYNNNNRNNTNLLYTKRRQKNWNNCLSTWNELNHIFWVASTHLKCKLEKMNNCSTSEN